VEEWDALLQGIQGAAVFENDPVLRECQSFGLLIKLLAGVLELVDVAAMGPGT
jgi:hypothetical protein